MTPVTEVWEPIENYKEYRFRPDMSLWVEDALSHMYTTEAVTSLRLCQDLFERYLVAAQEFSPQGVLMIKRMSRDRAQERLSFFSRYGLIAGRQWCILGKQFCEIILSPKVCGLLHMFQDMVIPDECFFQTVAEHFAVTNLITVKWDNIYHADAQNSHIDVPTLEHLISMPGSRKLFARKGDRSVTNEILERLLVDTGGESRSHF
jgi:hypothetical protein